MRIIPLVLLPIVTGCSAAPFFQGSKDAISAESIRTYAKAHGLSRDEARRELGLYRDAEYLKGLREHQATANSSPAAGDNPAAGDQPTAR